MWHLLLHIYSSAWYCAQLQLITARCIDSMFCGWVLLENVVLFCMFWHKCNSVNLPFLFEVLVFILSGLLSFVTVRTTCFKMTDCFIWCVIIISLLWMIYGFVSVCSWNFITRCVGWTCLMWIWLAWNINLLFMIKKHVTLKYASFASKFDNLEMTVFVSCTMNSLVHDLLPHVGLHCLCLHTTAYNIVQILVYLLSNW